MKTITIIQANKWWAQRVEYKKIRATKQVYTLINQHNRVEFEKLSLELKFF